MKIIAHDEDSMTNLFLSEVHRHEKLEDFLALIEWRCSSSMPFDVSAAELHQQVNFSEFGRPDAIILVTDSKDQKHVVIVEVKLGKYLDSCISTENGKFNNKFNSRLNNQLALKYRAMISLPSIPDKGYITELNHVAESPYSEDQIRRCKKPSTISLFKDIASNNVQFYLVTLTSDSASPLNEDRLASSDPCFPLFFDQRLQSHQEYRNLGSVLWSQCHQLFDGIDSHFSESFMLHFRNAKEAEEPTEAPKQEELFVRGRQIIKYAGKTCHLSCLGYSFTIRHFRDGKFIAIYQGQNDREKYLGLKRQIQILGKAPQKPIADTPFWETYFQAFNEDNQ
jgi:hypothetical protein